MEKPDVIPEGWKIKKLGSLVDPRSSNVDKKIDPGEIPVRLCNYTDVYYKNRITTSIDFMKASAKQREIDRFSLEKGDVIITKDSETPGDIAVPAYVSEELSDVVCGYHLTLLKPHKTESDGEFLLHLFQLPNVQHYFYVLANGITRFGLTADAISEAPLLTPPLPEQKKIATILSSVDEVIEKTRAQIDKLKDLKTGMMQELLTKGIGPGGVPHTEFKDSPVGRIPANWEIHPLSELAYKISDGIHTTPKYTEKSEYCFINGNNLKEGFIVIGDKAKYVPEEEYLRHKKSLNKNTILMSINGTIGNLAFYRGEKVVLGKSAAYISLKKGQSKDFIYYILQSDWVKRFYELELTGSTINNLSLGSIKNTPIPLPQKNEQAKIASIMGGLDELLRKKFHKLDFLSNVKKSLMQDLLTGKVRVNIDNNNEEKMAV